MPNDISVLVITAASIGFFHTILGPDHYLPFIVMSRAREWTLRKTTFITFLCGVGHVFSSVTLGIIGITFGVAVTKLGAIESFRGNIAAWGLIAFGLVYFIWGVRRAIKNKPHRHIHEHGGGVVHEHKHTHSDEHMHVHEQPHTPSITPWVLFTIFLFGPCEPLIPILMYPASQNSLHGLVLVTAIFGSVTIITMLGIVLVASFGVNFIPVKKLERYSHAIAGATILLCGLSIQFLGL